MMIKITEHCSMGCSHCMNNATPNNKHMDLNTFKKALDFQKTYGGPFCMITGGEPTEHPAFAFYLGIAMETLKNCYVTVATNGVWMQDNADFVSNMNNMYGNRLMFQVTNDRGYSSIRRFGIRKFSQNILYETTFQAPNVKHYFFFLLCKFLHSFIFYDLFANIRSIRNKTNNQRLNVNGYEKNATILEIWDSGINMYLSYNNQIIQQQ